MMEAVQGEDINGRVYGLGRGRESSHCGPDGVQQVLVLHPMSDDGRAPFPGEKVDSEEGKDLPKLSGLSCGTVVPPAQPLVSYFQAITCLCPRLPQGMFCPQALWL